MKKFLILLLLPLLFSCNQGEKIKTNLPKPTKPDDKASYLMGYDIGRQMIRDS
jgi:hypothetical protein